tara:strand:+ start:1767 stop:1952 length:186 start_codon:yes stop_codon:yes gene_type:complete
MEISTEQEVIDMFYPNDNTKTISDVIQLLKTTQQNHNLNYTEIEIKKEIKSSFTNVTDWSF